MFAAVIHFLAASGCTNSGSSVNGVNICNKVMSDIAQPLLTSMQVIIPAAIGISAIHKLMEHRESGGGVLVELITKGGGAVLVLQLIKAIAGVA